MLLLPFTLDVPYKYMNIKINTECREFAAQIHAFLFECSHKKRRVHEDDWFISLDTVYHDKTVFNSVGT